MREGAGGPDCDGRDVIRRARRHGDLSGLAWPVTLQLNCGILLVFTGGCTAVAKVSYRRKNSGKF